MHLSATERVRRKQFNQEVGIFSPLDFILFYLEWILREKSD